MFFRSLLLGAALSAAIQAQDQPQLVWQGEVDGATVMRVHGNRIDLEERQGLPVQRQRFRFYERLPDSRQNVRVQVVEGRGNVRVMEQPRPENNYTLSVLIDDRQGGRSVYSLEFFWESRGAVFRGPQPPAPRGSREETIWWSGRVDGEAVISCRGNVCSAEATRGAAVSRDRFRFSRPLPPRDVIVSLENSEGRGEVRIIEQPRASNGYAARVAIRDRQGGSEDYAFTLSWTPPGREDRGFEFSRRGLVWSGRVDGRVRVVVEGRNVTAEPLSGQAVMRERASFDRPLPERDNPNATVRRLHGRGRVEIVEYPSRRNGYRLVFEIDDSQGGADDYEVEVGW